MGCLEFPSDIVFSGTTPSDNKGDGTFPSAYAVNPGNATVLHPQVADFNGDGLLDIAYENNSGTRILFQLPRLRVISPRRLMPPHPP
jgi:hypothetical protein